MEIECALAARNDRAFYLEKGGERRELLSHLNQKIVMLLFGKGSEIFFNSIRLFL